MEIKGYCIPNQNQKLTYFVLYLKIINTILTSTIPSYSKWLKKLKNSIKICK